MTALASSPDACVSAGAPSGLGGGGAAWQNRQTNADGGRSTLGIKSRDPIQKAFLEERETEKERKKKKNEKKEHDSKL